MGAVLAAGVLACASPASAQGQGAGTAAGEPADPGPRVTVALLPPRIYDSIDPEDLEGVKRMAVGVLSAGLSNVSATQTYLDIGAGNRVFTSLYPGEDPTVAGVGGQVRGWNRIWDEIVERAAGAPADIVPGLLASTLEAHSVPIAAERGLYAPALIAVNMAGAVERIPLGACPTAAQTSCPGVSVIAAEPEDLGALAATLRGDDLLIALESPPPPSRDSLTIGIAGRGFEGNLTSDTTRTPGFVLATDIAPTILDRFEIEIPDEMNGNPIRSEGERDVAAVSERAGRMRVVAGRRASVMLDNLMIWAALALLVALLSRGRLAPPAFTLLGLATVYLPLTLLIGAAADTNELAERLITGVGAPGLAALTLYLRRDWSALAIACGVTVAAYAIDVIAGSPLTARSLLGPNPGLGVRFFGIGNELEVTLMILTTVGVGATLTALASRTGRQVSTRDGAIAFLAVAAVLTVVFAAGRFGADVGAAIVFPAAAAIAALALPGALRRRRLVLLVIGAPIAGLAALALIDLVAGGDAHLSRSVFEAGGADELADVFERRLRLSASSFERSTSQPLFWFAIAVVIAAIVFRRRLLAWLADVPAARAGLAGATGAMLLGIVANDSGALFLIIGAIALLACVAFAYAQFARSQAKNGRSRA